MRFLWSQMFTRRSRKAALGEQLYDGLRRAVRRGTLPPGARVPSSRELAISEGIARNTVLAVYARLLEEGYFVSRPRGGTFVAPELPDAGFRPSGVPAAPAPPRGARVRLSRRGHRLRAMRPNWAAAGTSPRYDFRYGRPSPDSFPRRIWQRLVAATLRASTVHDFDYGPPGGLPDLRSAIAEYVGRARAVACHMDQVLIVNGSQQALQLAADVLLDPGDRVIMEEPGYAGAANCFEAAGARVVPALVGPEGLDLRPLGPRARAVRLAYVTPSHQFPTGVVMTVARRLELLAWAERTDAWIFEDDYDSEFRFGARPVESLQGLDRHGRVVYAGTFSKVLFPTLRLGYLVLPEALAAPFLAAKALADTGTAGLEQQALARLLRSGAFGRHLRRTRARHAIRRSVLLDALDEHFGSRVEILGSNAGVHMMLRFPGLPVDDEVRVVERARRAGVGVYSPAPFFRTPRRRHEMALLLGYASLSLDDIRQGIARLARVVPRPRI